MNFNKLAAVIRAAVLVLALTAAYYFLGKLGEEFSRYTHNQLVLWPPTGFTLAVLMLWGFRWTPGILLGSLLTNLDLGLPLIWSLALAIIRTGGMVSAAWLVRRFAFGSKAFEQPRSILLFVLLTAAATLLTNCALLGTLCLAGHSLWGKFGLNLISFWMADFTSDLLLTTCLVVWLMQLRHLRLGGFRLESLSLTGIMVILGFVIFCGKGPWPTLDQCEWLFFLPMLWAALRFGYQGSVLSTLLTVGFALWGTAHDQGPFNPLNQPSAIFILQIYLATIGIASLLLVAIQATLIEARQTAENSEKRHRLIFENMPQGIVIHAASGKIVSMNPAAERILGRTTSDLLGKTSMDEVYCAIHPSGQPFSAAEHPAIVTLRTGMVVRDVIMGIINPVDQRQLWLKVDSFPLGNGRDKLLQDVYAMFDDITMNHEMFKQIRQSEQRYRGLAEALPDAVYILDSELVYRYANPTTAKWMGLPPEKIVGRKRSDFFPMAVIEEHQEIIDQVLKSGETQILEWEAPFLTGTRWIETRFLALPAMPGHSDLIMGISRDMTEKNELQQQLTKISEEERKRIGHDLHDGLGQQLSGIAFLAKALEGDLAKVSLPLTGDLKKITQLINESITQSRCLAQLLAPMETSVNNLPAVMKKLANDIHLVFRIETAFTTTLEKTSCKSETGMAFFRIAQEAIHNAIRHGAATRVEMHLWQEAGELCLRISDNGKGFPLVKIESNGLGLAIMKFRAKSAGGKIQVESTIGHGVQVICRLPF